MLMALLAYFLCGVGGLVYALLKLDEWVEKRKKKRSSDVASS